MVTAEGVFPKIGNDPVYTSEVNRFSYTTPLIDIGSFALLNSGASFQTVGSTVIGAGSLSNPAFLEVDGFFTNNVAFMLEISGASNAGSCVIPLSTDGNRWFHGTALIGSPMQGFLQGSALNSTAITTTISTINDINTSEEVVVKVHAQVIANTKGVQSYSVRGNRI